MKKKHLHAARPQIVLRPVTAKYDAAQTTPENAAHWSMATIWSADVEANPQVRRTLRSRARYEAANNPWVNGMIATQAYDIIGTGPRLQMNSGDPALDELLSREFSAWAQSVGLAEILHTARMSETRDGEIFLMLLYNPGVEGPVKLSVEPVECDRVTNYMEANLDESDIDGVHLDRFGNPVWYDVLKYHPGGMNAGVPNDSVRIPARYMLHMFRKERPGQHRGIPEITPALPLFAMLRRYTLAMVNKMENSANISGVITTNNVDFYEAEKADGTLQKLSTEQELVLPRGSFPILPATYDLKQLNLENPTDSQTNFSLQVKTEVARCLNLPKNVALGDSSGYNYASGRLDYQAYDKFLWIERTKWERGVLNPVFRTWLEEFRLSLGAAERQKLGELSRVAHKWFWDGREHVDPVKEASAQALRLQNSTTTLAEEAAREGLDWKTILRQRAEEKKLMQELGLLEEPSAGTAETGPDEGKNEDE